MSGNIITAEALIVGRSEGQFWLSAGLSFFILIVASQLVSDYYQTTEDTIKVRSLRVYTTVSSVQNFLVTTAGGVLHMISGWATLSFYSPLVRVPQ